MIVSACDFCLRMLVAIGVYYLSVYFRSLSLPDTHIQTSGDSTLHVFIQESGCPHTAVWMSSSGRLLGLLKIFSISVTLSVSDHNTSDQMGFSGLNTCEIPAEIILYVCIMCYEEARKKTIEEITLYFQSSLYQSEFMVCSIALFSMINDEIIIQAIELFLTRDFETSLK